VYDMYPWDNPANSAETRNSGPRSVLPGPRHDVSAAESAAAIRAVQVALDRRDNGGDAVAAAGRPATPLTAGRTRQ
jgi:hypothetical protein